MDVKPQELRIGNYVSFGGAICTVTEIEKDNFRAIDSHGNNWKNTFSALEGLPLTEQHLLDFGFEQDGYEMLDWVKNGLCFTGINWADKDFPEYQFLNFMVNEDTIISIHYVHQLQNIYFALTGQELTINNHNNG